MGRGILLILQLQGDAGTDELSDKYGKHRRIMHDLRAKALLMKTQDFWDVMACRQST